MMLWSVAAGRCTWVVWAGASRPGALAVGGPPSRADGNKSTGICRIDYTVAPRLYHGALGCALRWPPALAQGGLQPTALTRYSLVTSHTGCDPPLPQSLCSRSSVSFCFFSRSTSSL